MGAKPGNGVAVVPGNGFEVALGPLEPTAPWSIIPVKVSRPVELHLLAVWTRKEHDYVRGLDEALTVYTSFLMAAPAVVIGDFNANAIWDAPKKKTDFSRVAKRLTEQFGLVSAYHARSGEAYGSETQATLYFMRQRARPYHLDYCFVPAQWVQGRLTASILDGPPWDALSDHRPVVVDYAGRGAPRRAHSSRLAR